MAPRPHPDSNRAPVSLPSPAPQVEWLTTPEACALLRLDRGRLQDFMDAGEISYVDLGPRTRRFHRDDLEAFMDRRRHNPQAAAPSRIMRPIQGDDEGKGTTSVSSPPTVSDNTALPATPGDPAGDDLAAA